MKAISIARLAALAALVLAATFFCLCAVSGDGIDTIVLFVLTKVVGVILLREFAKACRRWRKSDPAVKAIHRWLASCSEDRPNPLNID